MVSMWMNANANGMGGQKIETQMGTNGSTTTVQMEPAVYKTQMKRVDMVKAPMS